ncbi:hypothetical protein B0H19DRAFT_1064486 [Mycena capillaripes]|nr:hypothetical protein B0H19DRAFT_1064486 [Mycena capillaripes]
MEPENCHSKEGKDTLSQQLSFQYTDQTKKLADETLLAIFRFALPPSWRMDYGTALPPFPRAICVQDLVSRRSRIPVRKCDVTENWAACCLMQAVETRAELGLLVRRLEICYLVPDGYHLFRAAEAKKIFELCPRITHFTFNPKVLPHAAPPIFPLPGLGQTMTNLDIGDLLAYPSVLPALHLLCRTLQSLSIILPAKYDDSHPTLDFTHLKNLRLAVAINSRVPGARWVIPGLQQVLFRPSWLGKPTAPLYHTAARSFLEAYGRTVKVLKVLPAGKGSPPLQRLLDRCPALQHLAAGDWHLDIPLRHGTLGHFDALRDSYTPVGSKEEEFERLRDMFPALRVCRFVGGCHDLLLDPPPIESTLGVVEQAIDYDLAESSWLSRMISSDECAADSEDCSDDYFFDLWPWSGHNFNEVSDTDSSESSESDSSAHVSELEDLDWHVDREEALAIFRRTLRS